MMNRRKWILLAVASLLIAAILGFGIIKFNQYRARALPIYPAPGYPQVSITSPTLGSQFAYGAPIIVEATAFSASKVLSVELYLDGVVLDMQSAPPGGSDLFLAEFLFYPPEPGVYTLVARANGADDLTATSSPVQIMITAPEYDSAAADTTDYALPDPTGISAPPDVPDSQPNPAEDWSGTPGNWINSLTADTLPNAPELVASLEGCVVDLWIHDLSDNEEGFEVRRLLPNSPSWASVNTLASQSQDEWITTTDSGAHGVTTYYVSAFNSQGVKDSNLVGMDVDPAECSPPSTERSVLSLKLESLETHIPVDRLYCYVSLDGEHWMRRPKVGFWPRGDAARGEGTFNAEIVSLSLVNGDGGLEPESNSVRTYLQCWGWQGDALHFLGEISPVLVADQRDSKLFGRDGFAAELVLNLEDYPEQLDFYPMSGGGDDEPGFGTFEDGIHESEPPWPEAIIDPTMPLPIPYITYDPDQCKSHLPPPFQNSFGQFLFCTPYPGFDLGDEGVNPQPYFIWNMSKSCLEGKGTPPCYIYEYWLYRAANFGHELGFNIYDQSSKHFEIHQVTAPQLFNFVIPVRPCSGYRSFWVQMWYYDGSSFLPTYGPPTLPLSIPCPDKLWPKMYLDITFDTLKLSSVDDGESAPQDVEVYGHLRARSESQTRYLNFARWNEQHASCPDESFSGYESLDTGGGLGIGCPQTFTNGTYNLGGLVLSQTDSYDPTWSKVEWGLGNNTVRLLIEEYDSLELKVKIVDWDDASANDLVCQATIQIPSMSIFDWYKVKDQTFTIIGKLSDGTSCTIEGVMNSVTPGYSFVRDSSFMQ